MPPTSKPQPTQQTTSTQRVAPVTRPSTEHQVSIGVAQCEFLDETMSGFEILETLSSFTFAREQHNVKLDRGVRKYLCDCLRARIQRSSAS